VTQRARVAAIQAELRRLELAVGVDQVVELIAEAGRGGANLVAFPETVLPGNPWWIWPDSGIQFVARYSANSEAAHLRGDRC
jgi:aliphatic nitrilase